MPNEPYLPGDVLGLYFLSLSVHGLVRGTDTELGRDADTGGQVLYVMDQARILAQQPEIQLVEVLTRQVWDKRVDVSYSEPREEVADGVRIVRLPFGPRRYLRKESLWPYLPSMVDQIMRLVRARGRAPDLIHGHYADAGFVGAQVAKILGVPFIFTGHSLGRVKKVRLLDQGQPAEGLEERYRFSQRIEAEEGALETAALVIASTRQEVREQYQIYDHYQPDRMVVIPPGVDLSRFSPAAPGDGQGYGAIGQEVDRFLADPGKPLIMAMARPDERKNFGTLVKAFGENRGLREKANLLLVMGNREDIREMPGGAKRVLTETLVLIDRYDLYGSVAYPKGHGSEDVPELYRKAAASGGVFVNPALTEPFGLTLLEAAASGLPVVATNDGGPQDILEACKNGVLVDPQDSDSLGRKLLEAIDYPDRWKSWSDNGKEGVHRHFTWKAHAKRYLSEVEKALGGLPAEEGIRSLSRRRRLPRLDRILLTDIDDTLTGNSEALEAFRSALEGAGSNVGFGIATGRTLDRALEALEELGVRAPDILITATGTEIHYGEPLVVDRSWERQINYRWQPWQVRDSLLAMAGVESWDEDAGTPFRLRFRLDPETGPNLAEIRRRLRRGGFRVIATLDHETDLDVTPVRASPGLAIRFLSHKWNLPPSRILVAGDSGNDADMLSGETLGVVVGNHTPELEEIRDLPRVFFAERDHAWGVLEGIQHYQFFDDIRIPDEDNL
ncbi:MAG: HAD-IIB family hydrolase [Gemmatimonadetes bacterium]|nr:HAD-IIB family hydrolase [Gemmatimonadota bacterium]NNM04984.1 HAD-IIB family hydrolase [Gemmatimonadota bacterium]